MCRRSNDVMRTLIDELVLKVSNAGSETNLADAMAYVTRQLDFDHFALSYQHHGLSSTETDFLLHDYPAPWAQTYVEFDLAGNDPIRRACERSMMGFLWCELDDLVPMSPGDRRMLSVGRANGIGDGYTVPRHLPGYASGSCTFALRPDRVMPRPMLPVAEIVGAFALTTARRLAGESPIIARPVLSPRQRECVLWSARGKTAADIATILSIGEDTVIQHLRTARERYDVHSRNALILCALFDGLISFADIRRWWYFH
ncbi:LuxR family transcriptional regulator [Sphingomonas glacialis]|uniref:LuxR family transcriptional regulator n=2 Tax=Sphingomonadaceae TaxID=41297 RepID=A0A502FTK0_9SPHN|nr:LuxR family transcriptional regulator [Sphingomonas glacialis]